MLRISVPHSTIEPPGARWAPARGMRANSRAHLAGVARATLEVTDWYAACSMHDAVASAEVSPMIEFQRILVPLDFSECARSALHVAICFSRHFGSRIDVFHVFEHADLDKPVPDLEARIDRLVPPIPDDVKRKVGFRLDVGDPAERICAAARRFESNLVVIGRHGSPAGADNTVGEVTSRVMRGAPCVVMSVDAGNLVDAFDLMNLAVLHASRGKTVRRAAS